MQVLVKRWGSVFFLIMYHKRPGFDCSLCRLGSCGNHIILYMKQTCFFIHIINLYRSHHLYAPLHVKFRVELDPLCSYDLMFIQVTLLCVHKNGMNGQAVTVTLNVDI